MVKAKKDSWALSETTAAAEGAAGVIDGLPERLLQSKKFVLRRAYRARMVSSDSDRAAPPDLVLREDAGADDLCLLAIRHPSGALTFHTGALRRSDSAAPLAQYGFRVPIRRLSETKLQGDAVNAGEFGAFILNVAAGSNTEGAGASVPLLAARWEDAIWRDKSLSEGWFQVSPGGPYGISLTPRKPTTKGRSLLLLHGLLSDASATFAGLTGTGFFDRVRELYGDRIYAFNYHSVSRTPAETGRRLLEQLPAGRYLFDAITHSSGGLVLRSALEHERHGASNGQIELRHGALVACPNEGTPLAAPSRRAEMINWLANLLEMFPLNPLSFGWDFIPEALSWIARDSGSDIPGISAMDPAGPIVANLQSSPLPEPYSALVANYHPDASLWRRAQDAGLDDFFSLPSDLLMPTEGGWRIRRQGGVQLAAARIGCFGPGGNLPSNITSVHHLNYFGRSETAAFLAATLAGVHDECSSLDANAPLPYRRPEQRAETPGLPRIENVPPAAVARSNPATAAPLPTESRSRSETNDWEAFHLLILSANASDPHDKDEEAHEAYPARAHIVASYRGATVIETIPLRREEHGPPTSFGKIIGLHRQIKDYTNHSKGALPADDELMEFASLLFETLFRGNVRRLYDEARSRQRSTKLELVLTSTIPWLDQKPWELCYDRSRASFLATEEILFVRNVPSAIPADAIPGGDGRLRILIASAQAVNLGRLSAAQEEDDIRRGFQPLVDAGLVEIEILSRATPETIHRRLEMGRFNVVHFISHGHFDERRQEGYLVFEDAYGRPLWLGPRSVREIFCGRGLSVVFLNSCESGAGSRFVDFNLGLAQTLLAHGLPALVANQFVVRDASATVFARCFYASLAQGNSIGHAAREARIAVNYSPYAEPIDWAVPVVYTRNARLALCQRRKLEFDLSLLDVLSVGKRALGDRGKRIAVWDLDGTFPALHKTLLWLNNEQTTYAFEAIELSPPSAEFWDVSAQSRVLDPEHVANSLRNKIPTLGVELLVCVTRQPLRDQQRGWWPANRKTAVVIISCAGIDLPDEGALVDGVLANAMVVSLAKFFGGAGAHAKGAKTCPLAFDDSAPDSLSQRLAFDVGCLQTLEKSMPRELPALKELAKLF